MAEIRQPSGNQVLDYMARDYDSLLAAMRGLIPEKLPEWTDYASEADFGNVLLELFSHMGDIISYYQDRIANESFLGTATERRSIIQHLKDRKLVIPLSLLLAGIIMGFFWEFWNYWAVPKWTYDVPFVGFFKIFEMPILGYLGYFPFAFELYAMYFFIQSLFIKKERLLRS